MADLISSLIFNIPFWSMLVFVLVFGYAEIARRSGRPQSGTARTGLIRFGVGVVGAACAIMALNYVVNPFGIYPSHLFKPVANVSRKVKLQVLEQVAGAPKVVILGSSRSLNISPAAIQQKTGLLAFNAAVFDGRPRDYLAFALYLEQHHKLPDAFIIGLGMEQISSDEDKSPKFEPDDPLDQYVQSVEVLPSILSIEQTQATFKQLGAKLVGREVPVLQFAPDGTSPFIRPQEEVEQSVDDLISHGYTISEKPSEIQFDYLARFLELCKSNNVRVIIYLPPYHPRALAYYLTNTPYPRLKSAALARLEALKAQHPFSLYDFTDVKSFGGDATSMYDYYHPSDAGSQQMLSIMMQNFNQKTAASGF